MAMRKVPLMIKGILLPEKIGNYYLFTQRIVGFDIGKTHVTATKILLRGNNTIIQQCLEEKLDAGNAANYAQRAGKAIESLIKRVGSYDYIVSSLASTSVITKEITLPFTDMSKIEQVIPFEIESLLPFDLDQAAIDFIVTKQDIEQNISTVLIAAVQQSTIDEHIALFSQLGLDPDRITIDLIQLHGLYQMIPKYKNIAGAVALIDLGFNATRIAYIYDGQLRRIRTLPTGISHLSKIIADHMNIQPGEAFEYILRFGIHNPDNPEYEKLISESLSQFFSKIQFTLASAATQINVGNAINKILLVGGGAHIKALPEFASKLFGTPCQLFETQAITLNNNIEIKKQIKIPLANTISLATALENPGNPDFNLNKITQQKIATRQFATQFIVASILTGFILIGLIGNSWLSGSILNKEIQESEQEAIDLIESSLNLAPEDMPDLETALENAKRKVIQEEKRFDAFSRQKRNSILMRLTQLTHDIDRKGIGLQIKSLAIDENGLSITGKVKDDEAITNLQEQLKKSNLFISVPDLQMTSFTITSDQLQFKNTQEDIS